MVDGRKTRSWPTPCGIIRVTALWPLCRYRHKSHWTGHASRLDRDLAHPFGSEGYAKEELRAEIASMIVGDELGIGHDPGQHAAYVGSWIKALQDAPLEIFRASSDAEKIHDYVLAFEQVQVQEQDQAQQQEKGVSLNKRHQSPIGF